MSSLMVKAIFSRMLMRRSSPLNIADRTKVKVTMGDPLEHATGIEKRELLAQLAGNTDPYHNGPIKRGPGTRQQPTEIPSAMDSRFMGCICHEDAHSVAWMRLDRGEPKRCACGYWFVLVPISPL